MFDEINKIEEQKVTAVESEVRSSTGETEYSPIKYDRVDRLVHKYLSTKEVNLTVDRISEGLYSIADK